jgi:enoyl-CoA hydratase/carnithine racemase
MATLDEYQHKFARIRFERQDGIMQVSLHTNDGPFIFDEQTHHDFGTAFAAVADDDENKVVILTGTGDRFCGDFDAGSFYRARGNDPEAYWKRTRKDGFTMLSAFLDIQVPVIAAINGPVVSHSELPLLADVVLATPETIFQDATHFIVGLPPGDGMHLVWTALLGPNGGRYFLMTGQKIGAVEARERGVIGEIVESGQLLDRAWSLARSWLAHPPMTLMNTRAILTYEWRRRLAEQQHSGLTYEALADFTRPRSAPSSDVVDLLATR